ncbi:dTDP-D-glucose 4,6-dehydratase [Legionella waltersii]|uniref:dTDP-glucose 4,6-dehydratase n=2 Tax=Legionella waltersii TaxID=66969 RepID=A0A0W1ANC3_9GAMM|nr:dTDP-glucose 4,6-dehydratase [Legionella waltersii]KTD82752.1 dTDP-D-glucose 4,6-dehydratase [Legionella waltersii]SNV01099.1 dTDP-D-glucose 4,6-dehydratase [Legionella waltersii]
MEKKLKILVTGGAGFIGTNLIRFLINNTEHSVLNIDSLTYASNINSLESIANHPRYSFIKVDICFEEQIRQIIKEYRPNAVMHLAAESHVDNSIEAPVNFIRTNVIGTYNLLQATLDYWYSLGSKEKEGFRFHHISTDEVYGDLKISDSPFTEASSYNPSSPYSASKASSDHFVRAWGRTFGLPVLITNCSNNFGPFQHPEKLIPKMIINALNGSPLPVYGNGKQMRDWIFVEDHVRGLYVVLIKGLPGNTYNIGGNSELENICVIKNITDLLDELLPRKIESQLSYSNLITYVNDRPGHDIRYAIDCTKMKTELNWYPIADFKTSLRKTVEWYIQNQSWWCKFNNLSQGVVSESL